MGRMLNDFNEKEKKAMQTQAKRLLYYATAIVDGDGDQKEYAIDFEVTLHNMHSLYENLKKYKGGGKQCQ